MIVEILRMMQMDARLNDHEEKKRKKFMKSNTSLHFIIRGNHRC